MTTLTPTDRYLYAARLKGFLDKHEDAVQLLTEAIDTLPADARLYRYRGHRRITLRDFAGAKTDLEQAARLIQGTEDEHEFYQRDVEPDLINLVLGREDQMRDPHIPVNPETIAATKGMYKSTLHGSIWYHLALAKYLVGDFDGANDDFLRAREVAVDDDLEVAILDWRYMSLRRAGRDVEAASLLESLSTALFSVNTGEDFYLRRLKLYKGEAAPDELLAKDSGSHLAVATQGYGVGNWYLYNGQPAEASAVFDQVLTHGFKNAFGYLAAEVDQQRLAATNS